MSTPECRIPVATQSRRDSEIVLVSLVGGSVLSLEGCTHPTGCPWGCRYYCAWTGDGASPDSTTA